MTETEESAPGQHVCPHCAKPFARLCDLNKHAKSHSRPFKCAIQTCKYHQHGWPTAKELERHINDKHSVAPRTYACRFPPCTYKSKRESNCKQHMEKTHRWKYIRSKSNGKHISGHRQDDVGHRLHVPGTRTLSAIPSPNLSFGSPHQDFVLYPYDNDGSIMLEDEEDEDDSYDPQRGQDSQVYLPWTSPNTRLRRNENFLETFSQTYNGPPDRPAGNTDGLIDPSLPQYTSVDLTAAGMSDPANFYTSQPLIKTEVVNTTAEQLRVNQPDSRRGSLSDDARYKRSLPTIQNATYPSSGQGQPTIATSSMPGGRLSYSSSGKPILARRRDGDDEESEDENRSPLKRRRSNPVENFSDTDMPDIFRFAHPRIYDRDQKEKFSPCHSSHRDISTLVRHLSRPAHRLQVTDRFVSSFDVNDPEYRHPRLGLCRRCWLAFPDRQDFENHMARSCDKVSKGKREKWRILLDSFTPLIQHQDEPEQTSHAVIPEQRRDSIGSRRPSNPRNYPEHVASPAATPFSATPGFQTVSQFPNPGFVPMSEHLKLQREHNALCHEHRELCRKHHQLVLATRAYFQRQQPYHGQLATSAQRPSANLALTSDQPHRLGAGAAPSTSSKDSASDQESLVLHMDSHPTDVDIQGLMDEAPESLSRQNSGLSSMSRSTIHHVPNSPPPRPSDEGSSDFEDDEFGEAKEPSPSRRPPSSIPDSAYGTDPRRGSLGDQGGCCGEGIPASGSGMIDPVRSHGHGHNGHDLSKMNSMGEMSINRRKPAAADVVGGSSAAGGIGMLPILWGNPWGESQPSTTAAAAAAAGTTNQPSATETMAHHHHNKFANGGDQGPAAAAGASSSESQTESISNFDFLNMDLDHFDLGWNE
ncbi:hypothetical protein QBC37DRAFT_280314 [Rhypophila decipiens]|uniref:C2H2-type domain-containing protein n=1 Tax=Rhypophila decipiens TaxID=261697 RepID=A0AAN6YE04_9PEZI|nr:hypothetical protein QBC37DRAFT_280314 [Rhypophila decipiens]